GAGQPDVDDRVVRALHLVHQRRAVAPQLRLELHRGCAEYAGDRPVALADPDLPTGLEARQAPDLLRTDDAAELVVLGEVALRELDALVDLQRDRVDAAQADDA